MKPAESSQQLLTTFCNQLVKLNVRERDIFKQWTQNNISLPMIQSATSSFHMQRNCSSMGQLQIQVATINDMKLSRTVLENQKVTAITSLGNLPHQPIAPMKKNHTYQDKLGQVLVISGDWLGSGNNSTLFPVCLLN